MQATGRARRREVTFGGGGPPRGRLRRRNQGGCLDTNAASAIRRGGWVGGGWGGGHGCDAWAVLSPFPSVDSAHSGQAQSAALSASPEHFLCVPLDPQSRHRSTANHLGVTAATGGDHVSGLLRPAGSGGAGAHSPAFGGVRASVGADAGAGVAVHVDLQQVGVGVGLQLPRCVSARQQERRSCRVSALRCSWPFSFRGPVVFTHCRLIWCAAARVFCLRLLSFYLVRCHLVLFCLLVRRGTENNGMAAPCRHAVRLCELGSR